MIRKATSQDLPHLVRMAGDFIAAADAGLPFDPDYLTSSFAAMIVSPTTLLLVLDVDHPCGVFCAEVSRSPWAPVPLAVEKGFWIDPPYRGRWALKMLRAYAEWAEGLGCDRAFMGAFADNPMDKLYKKAGFSLSELMYSRAF